MTALAVLLACEMLPQAAFWVPAAFCVVPAAALLRARGSRGRGLCLLAGALCGTLLFGRTLLLQMIPAQNDFGRTAVLEGEVVKTGGSYADGMVSADIAVRSFGGERRFYTVRCGCMPDCTPGQEISGAFALTAVEAGQWQLDTYADGVFAQAEYTGGFAAQAARSPVRGAFYRLQRAMSGNIRYYVAQEEGGILAAMTVGDRRFISDALYTEYQAAGIPHVLAVSGLHLSLLCGLLPVQRKNRLWRLAHAGFSIAAAVFLIGVTGASPSILRAGIAVLILNVGILLGRPADPLTSLAVSGTVMSFSNAYTVMDIAFELSFAATAGVLAASAWMRRLRRDHPPQGTLTQMGMDLTESAAISGFASLFTLPVLVLQGMSLSTVSVLTNLLTLWLIAPILICGFGAALFGFWNGTKFLQYAFSLPGGLLVQLLNRAVHVFAALPFARLHPETNYPAAVVLVLAVFLLLARKLRLPPVRSGLCAAALLGLAFFTGTMLSRDLIKIALIGNAQAPSVVLTQRGEAAVLFRGGAYNEQAVRTYLADAGIGELSLLVDLRMSPRTACALQAEQTVSLDGMEPEEQKAVAFGSLRMELARTKQGGTVLLTGGRSSIGVASGTAEQDGESIPVDLFLASSGAPGVFSGARAVLSLSKKYSWLDSAAAETVYYGETGSAVWLRPAGKWARWPMRYTGVTACRSKKTTDSAQPKAALSIISIPQSLILPVRSAPASAGRCWKGRLNPPCWTIPHPHWNPSSWRQEQFLFSGRAA